VEITGRETLPTAVVQAAHEAIIDDVMHALNQVVAVSIHLPLGTPSVAMGEEELINSLLGLPCVRAVIGHKNLCPGPDLPEESMLLQGSEVGQPGEGADDANGVLHDHILLWG
jgi:hypothetical protein